MNQQQKTDSSQATLLDYLHNLVGMQYLPDGRGVDGVDCYGLVVMFYREALGIEVPSLIGTYTGNVSRDNLEEIANKKAAIWTITDSPIVGDVILFKNGLKRHTGLWVERGKMIHSTSQTNTCIEKYDSFMWKKRVVGIYRHKNRKT